MFICNKCKKVFPDLDGYGMRIQYTVSYTHLTLPTIYSV